LSSRGPGRSPRSGLALAWAINAPRALIANGLLAGVWIHAGRRTLVGSGVLGFANAVLKPVLAILTLPLIVFTFGFFYLVINIGMVAPRPDRAELLRARLLDVRRRGRASSGS
jgi:hypothetical protein